MLHGDYCEARILRPIQASDIVFVCVPKDIFHANGWERANAEAIKKVANGLGASYTDPDPLTLLFEDK